MAIGIQIVSQIQNILKVGSNVKFFLLLLSFLPNPLCGQGLHFDSEVIDSTISTFKINTFNIKNIDSALGFPNGIISKNYSIKSYDIYTGSIDLLVNNSYYMTIWLRNDIKMPGRFSFVEICRKANSLKLNNYTDSVQWDSLPKTGLGVYLGMKASEFSSVMKNVVFDRISSYKNYWVFEYGTNHIGTSNDTGIKDTFRIKDLRHHLTDRYTPSKDQLAMFKLKANNENYDRFIARYIFYHFKLVKYEFGFYPFFPTGTFEGLIY